jgi:hypothetical protein
MVSSPVLPVMHRGARRAEPSPRVVSDHKRESGSTVRLWSVRVKCCAASGRVWKPESRRFDPGTLHSLKFLISGRTGTWAPASAVSVPERTGNVRLRIEDGPQLTGKLDGDRLVGELDGDTPLPWSGRASRRPSVRLKALVLVF